MIVVASSNGKVGISAAMEVLRNGGSAIDAVEAGIRLVESNPQDNTVGLGGIPNLLGEVELDASIMDGRTLAAGAVAAVQGYENPISIARKVMEELPHVLLAGSGAERFAAEMGFQRRELLTEETREVWKKRLLEAIPEAVLPNLREEPALRQWVKRVRESWQAGGTVNFLAQDADGNICAGRAPAARVGSTQVAWATRPSSGQATTPIIATALPPAPVWARWLFWLSQLTAWCST